MESISLNPLQKALVCQQCHGLSKSLDVEHSTLYIAPPNKGFSSEVFTTVMAALAQLRPFSDINSFPFRQILQLAGYLKCRYLFQYVCDNFVDEHTAPYILFSLIKNNHHDLAAIPLKCLTTKGFSQRTLLRKIHHPKSGKPSGGRVCKYVKQKLKTGKPLTSLFSKLNIQESSLEDTFQKLSLD